jgi:hypothetical protein
MRAIYLDSEERWPKLAASYEATARLTHFLGEKSLVDIRFVSARRDVADRDARVNQEIHLRVQGVQRADRVDGK